MSLAIWEMVKIMVARLGFVSVLYMLRDPRPGKRIAYIGQSVNPVRRYRAHLAHPETKILARWFAAIRDAGASPKLLILARTSNDAVDVLEEAFIRRAREAGWFLTNTAPGGSKPPSRRGTTWSSEQRARYSAVMRGRPKSPEHRAAMAQARIGRVVTSGEAISRGWARRLAMGYRRPESAKAVVAAKLRGRPVSAETRARISAAKKGKQKPTDFALVLSAITRHLQSPRYVAWVAGVINASDLLRAKEKGGIRRVWIDPTLGHDMAYKAHASLAD